MQTTRTDPPYIPLRRSGWPTRRAPRWAMGVGAVLLAAAVAVGLSHRPTTGQRAADLRGLLHQINADIESCSGGVRESLFVLHEIDTGTSHDVRTAVNVADTASANCSPANNELLDDLTTAQTPESLASYHLQGAVTALIDWAAPHAEQVAGDVATVLSDRGKPAEATDRAALRQALRKLDGQRAVVDAALEPAIRALSPASAPPTLYG
ncbi:MAG TPA: hypothetical protein VMU94_20675 [Streptosporangiaceae bacterium]|nr:hypothetical protein [Streptosporangiaceae bacterium]